MGQSGANNIYVIDKKGEIMTRIHITLGDELAEKLKERAAKEKRSVSNMANLIMAEALSGGDEKIPALKKAKMARPLELPGLEIQTAKELIRYRNSMKAPLTKMAWAGMVREAKAAGIPIEKAVGIMMMRGWRGMKADWLIAHLKENPTPESFAEFMGERIIEGQRL